MSRDLDKLIEIAKQVPESLDQREKQRRSFAYGNTAIENDLITKEMVEEEAELMKRQQDRDA